MDGSLGKVKEEGKEKTYGCMGINHALPLKDAGKAHFCQAGKGKMRKKGKEDRKERGHKPLYVPSS